MEECNGKSSKTGVFGLFLPISASDIRVASAGYFCALFDSIFCFGKIEVFGLTTFQPFRKSGAEFLIFEVKHCTELSIKFYLSVKSEPITDHSILRIFLLNQFFQNTFYVFDVVSYSTFNKFNGSLLTYENVFRIWTTSNLFDIFLYIHYMSEFEISSRQKF